ncbi:hypothetical protein LJR034_009017 [Caballeronia sp. LjRoot34]
MQLQITMTALVVVSTLLTIATFSRMAVARLIIQKVAVRRRVP